MSQKIKIQDGRVVYEAASIPDEPSTTPVERNLNFDIKGIANVTKQVNVGDDPLADGLITTPSNTDLYISPSKHLNLVTNFGNITLNGSVWPTNSISPGMFIGASSLGNLTFLSFMIGTAPNDYMTSTDLENLYPDAQFGQQVLGPTSLYQKVSAGQWRNISALGFIPVDRAGDTMTGPLILSGNPTNPLQASTKEYVDNVAQGIVAKPSVLAATTVDLSSIYNNGIDGEGATLTSTVNGTWPGIDGVISGWDIGTGVLVKNQTNLAENGRYYISDLGSASTPWVLTRCIYCDTAAEIPGAYVFVQNGSQEATGWIQVVTDPSTFVVGTDPIYVYQFSGAGTYLPGPGISIIGNTISNTGVSSNIAGNNITLSNTTGDVTINLTTDPSINGTNFTNIPNSALTNNSVTIGTTNIPLGGSATVLTGLTSVTSTNFYGTFNGDISGGTVTGDIVYQGDVTIQNNLYRSVLTGISATGTTLGTATVLVKDINVVSTVALNTGVSLQAEVAGLEVIVMNMGANDLRVYPSSAAAKIDSLALGAAFTLPVGAKIMFICVSATQWYTLNATYA